MRLVFMSLESNKTLGGVGSIFLAIPFLNLVGIILVLVAMNGLADYYEEEGIFKNALYGLLFVPLYLRGADRRSDCWAAQAVRGRVLHSGEDIVY